MSLCDQPPELLDVIASYLPFPSDLLSLALANKLMYGIVVPEHLSEFHHVCCDARRRKLWKSLSDHPGSARILSLEVLPEAPSVQRSIPQSLNASSDEELQGDCGPDCGELLAAAIAAMPRLRRFSFQQSTFTRTHNMKPVFDALRRRSTLREVEITFHDRHPGRQSFERFSAPLWEFSNLTRLSITVTRYPDVNTPRPFLEKMFAMLSTCPRLKDMRIASEMLGPHADISAFLSDKLWPNLRRLVVEGDLTFHAPEKLSSFLLRHPKLEILSLPQSYQLPLIPSLRCLELFAPGAAETVNATHLPHLEYFATADVDAPMQTNVDEILDILRALPALRGVTVAFGTPSGVKKLARTLPRLQRLTFAASPWNQNRLIDRPPQNYLPSPECLAILSSFPCLTHLDTSIFIKQDEHTETVLDDLCRTLAAAPKLEYVGVDFVRAQERFHRPKWFIVLRDADEGYAGRREIRDLRELELHDWEGVSRIIGISWVV
ncbi:hypothetical protein B0H16DRAFT_1589041 [Mycena metata]|uniref:F-box domain-containing protein n=1 Tax=Mycena metata TaxID=1033252 RepID=A0AAD7HU88_9AGAR|nr:hypothetical protein B0H16DRAFT_1589041 [Mycena metata]